MSRTFRSLFFAVLVTVTATAGAAADGPKVSKPGEYRGYTPAMYDGHLLTSRYVTVRDGTRLAVDVFLPTLDGKVATDKLPTVWMHTPYNRRTTSGG